MESKKSRWLMIAIIAAIVAAITTIIVFVLRARAKRKAWCEQEAFEYNGNNNYNRFDMDDDVDVIEE